MLLRWLADGTLLLIFAIAAPVLLWHLRRDFWQRTPVLVMAGLTSLLVGKLMGLAYQPSSLRPFQELGQVPGAAYIDNPGFPSDHMLLAVVIVIAVYMVTRRKALTMFLAVCVVLMGVARVMALVHTPLDILGGIVAGFSGAFWYRKLTK